MEASNIQTYFQRQTFGQARSFPWKRAINKSSFSVKHVNSCWSRVDLVQLINVTFMDLDSEVVLKVTFVWFVRKEAKVALCLGSSINKVCLWPRSKCLTFSHDKIFRFAEVCIWSDFCGRHAKEWKQSAPHPRLPIVFDASTNFYQLCSKKTPLPVQAAKNLLCFLWLYMVIWTSKSSHWHYALIEWNAKSESNLRLRKRGPFPKQMRLMWQAGDRYYSTLVTSIWDHNTILQLMQCDVTNSHQYI